ncbi:MAG: cyanophycinase [Bacteroidales bacterium]|nr:cyanophycinase [Bacteroidales bacterium]
MRIYISLAFFCIMLVMNAYSQRGRLLIVGGGSEKTAAIGWSTPAYTWAVEGKRVAVIGTSTGSLAPYLKQYCKAAYAREFAIDTRDSADSQVTYDTLMTYQAIFFRGGDQWEYYSLYRNTMLQQAVEDIFAAGGTICGTSAGMHILSETVFTAENGTVYPYEGIENPNNSYMTLEDDFFGFVPGYLFDTHFAERGRFGRLCGFLANLKLNENVDVIGLGIDDLSCMAIDSNLVGTAYGTGCTNIYKLTGSVSLNGNKLLIDSVSVTQLLQGCTYNFVTGEAIYTSLTKPIDASTLTESGNYTILASGSDLLSSNQEMLSELVLQTGNQTDAIAIISENAGTATSFMNALTNLAQMQVDMIEPSQLYGSDTSTLGILQRAGKVLFVSNDPEHLLDFLGSINGNYLEQKLRASGSISAFVGMDSRLAGKTVVGNFLEYGNSYYGEMTLGPGLGLLRNSVIIPNTYLNSDIYENTATAVPYAMVKDTLKYGIWLTNHSFMKYSPVDGNSTLTGKGIAPVMILTNTATLGGFSTQTSTGSTSSLPRQVAGFDQMQLSLIDDTRPFIMGKTSSISVPENAHKPHVSIITDRITSTLRINAQYPVKRWELVNAGGQILATSQPSDNPAILSMQSYPHGIYILKITLINNPFSKSLKIAW